MGYRIKTVSSLTGVPRSTLLAWERRYGVVEPSRQDNGYREYSDADVACLQALKGLLDDGYKVSEAISLITRARAESTDPPVRPGGVRYLAVHATLAEQAEATSASSHNLQPLRVSTTLDDALKAPVPTVDVVVADISLLGDEPLSALRTLRDATQASSAVATFDFATHATLARLVREGVRLVQGPIRMNALQQAILEQQAFRRRVRLPPAPEPSDDSAEAEAPRRRFDDNTLARLRETRSSLECECPNHVAALVSSLAAFEDYCSRCESSSADDVAFHAWLGIGTARARAVMEELLTAICEQDGIEL